jgi:hypothetical protein
MIGMAFLLQFIAGQRSPRSKVRFMIASTLVHRLAIWTRLLSVFPSKRCVPLCPGQLCFACRDNAFIERSSERF